MAPELEITASNSYVENELHKRLRSLGDEMNCSAIACICPIIQPIDDFIRNAIEDIKEKRKSLAVILETSGGFIETAERIADTLRKNFPGEIHFIIPSYAMSAGTVLVMSGDHIYMDYYSVLGPIDPQIRSKGNSGLIPALGYLEKYEEMIAKSKKGRLTAAELAFLIEKFDPAELHQFEQARGLSVDLLKDWLVKYKFKNWSVTTTRRRRVTKTMKVRRAAEIARMLNDTKKWKSHGRGISMRVLENDLNLTIIDFGSRPKLNSCIRSYYRLLQDYISRRDHNIIIHTPDAYFAI